MSDRGREESQRDESGVGAGVRAGRGSRVRRSRGRYVGGVAGAFQPFATGRLRQESHGILAREMLHAVRRGLPLDEALEAFTLSSPGVPRAAWNVVLVGAILLPGFAYFAMGPWGVVIAILLYMGIFVSAAGTGQSDNYYRHVGLVLCRELRRGRTLGEAFRHHPELFDPFEATLMEAGDGEGRLEKSIDAWGRHAASSERLGHSADMAIYPTVAGAFLLSFIALLFYQIVPRIQEVWDMLESEYPGSMRNSQAMAVLSDVFSPTTIPIFIFFSAFLALSVLPRRFFNGSTTGSICYVAFTYGVYLFLFWFCSMMTEFWDRSGWFDAYGDGYLATLAIPLAILLSAGLTWVTIRLARWWTGRGGDRLPRLLSFLPGMRGALRHLDESKFLFTLSALLGGGMPWPEAASAAGRAVGHPRWIRAGDEAAAMANRGCSVADIFRGTAALLPETCSRLTAGEFSGRLVESLAECAEQDHHIGDRALSRFNTVFFPLAHIVVGALVGVYVVILYYPFLLIPVSVGLGG